MWECDSSISGAAQGLPSLAASNKLIIADPRAAVLVSGMLSGTLQRMPCCRDTFAVLRHGHGWTLKHSLRPQRSAAQQLKSVWGVNAHQLSGRFSCMSVAGG